MVSLKDYEKIFVSVKVSFKSEGKINTPSEINKKNVCVCARVHMCDFNIIKTGESG